MMKVEIKDISGTKKAMEVVVPKADVEKFTDEIYLDISKGANIKGFRKGKAPRDVIRMYYGDYITGELSKKLVSEKFEEAVKEHELFVVSMPEIENEPPQEGQDFTFSATFDVKPSPKPETYSGFELQRLKTDLSEDAVDNVLTRIRETHAKVEEAEDPQYQARKGDYVSVDVSCEENPSLNRDKITVEAGVRSSLPGLQDTVIGMSRDEEKQATLDFPADHFLEEMRGKTAQVKVVVSSIKTRDLPELTDDFAKEVRDDVETLAELRDKISSDLKERAAAEARKLMEKQISDKLIEANPFDVPESMVRLQAAMMLQGMSQRLSAQGMRMQDVFPDAEFLKEESMTSAERTVRLSLIMEAIAKEQGIEADEAQIEAEIGKMAESYGLAPEEVRKGLEESERLDEIKFGIIERRVFDYIIDNSQVEEVEELKEEESDDAGADSGGTDE